MEAHKNDKACIASAFSSLSIGESPPKSPARSLTLRGRIVAITGCDEPPVPKPRCKACDGKCSRPDDVANQLWGMYTSMVSAQHNKNPIALEFLRVLENQLVYYETKGTITVWTVRGDTEYDFRTKEIVE